MPCPPLSPITWIKPSTAYPSSLPQNIRSLKRRFIPAEFSTPGRPIPNCSRRAGGGDSGDGGDRNGDGDGVFTPASAASVAMC